MENHVGFIDRAKFTLMDVSIIIVNYNTKDLLAQCIHSIKDNTLGIAYEIIVVDNDSHDASVEMLKMDFPQVAVVEAGGNIGFGRANNLGMQIASGKYLFLLNSDTILVNNAVKDFYDQAEQLKQNGYKVGAIGSILLTSSMSTCHSYGKFITPKSELTNVLAKYLRFLKYKNNTNPDLINEPTSVDYITGADLFIPKTVFDEIGGFDPAFFMYCEEVDWQKRMKDHGYERLIVPGPEIIHLEGGSDSAKRKLWSPSRLANIYTSKKIYQKKNFNPYIYPFFRMAYKILNTPSIVLTAMMTKNKEYLKLIQIQ